MKKIISFVIAFIVITATAGCKNTETPVEPFPSSETQGTSGEERTEPPSTSGPNSGETTSADAASDIITTAEETADGTAVEESSADEETTAPDVTTVHEHTIVIDGKREPTCTEPGLTEGRHCSECGEVIEKQEQIPAKGHSFADTVVAPTTSAKGYTEHVCTVCGYSYRDNYTDRLLYDETVLQGFGLGFVLKSREDREICGGVTFSVMNYEDREGVKHAAYVVTASPDTVSLEMGLPGSTGQLNGLATVYDQTVTAERVLGYDIIASVNADLFGATVAGMPNGTTILNGELLYRDTVGYQGFAVMNDGSYRFLNNAAEFANQAANIRLACGGRYLVLKDGKIFDNGTADPFCTVHHPRTAFGVKKDGTMLFVVVDGRQSGYSDGATLLDLSVIFYRLGAVNAINLDGGGSTGLFLKDDGTGDFVCANRPTETNPYRKVVNTLFFVKKN